MPVRPLTEHDAATLRALRLRALRDDPDPFLSTYEEEREWPLERTTERLRALRGAEGEAVLGAFEDGALVGMLGILRELRRKAMHRATLWGMYVAPEARGRGHGRALLEAALARLEWAAGLEQVHLAVVTTNEPARRLYRSAGFVVVGVLPGAMKDGERYLDEELWMLRLRGAPG